jgi:sugar lactone lactonase YvrE
MSATLNVLADDQNLCGEAPIWDATSNCLYWSDCVGLKFFRYDWLTKQRKVVREGVEVNGCVLNEPGGFVIANNSGVWLWDGSSSLELVASEVSGAKCQLNDCIADPRGRLISGSWFYDPKIKPKPLAKLFCIDRDGRGRVLDEGFYLSNGLGFSPDSKTLYFADSVARCVFAYDYDAIRGAVSKRRVFIKLPKDAGIPDGLTVDAEGFVWLAEWYGSRIRRFDPDGKVERQIITPAKQTSSLIFGGFDMTDIFITSAGERSEPIPVMPTGYDPSSGYLGGKLYHVNFGIKGKADFKANISLTG